MELVGGGNVGHSKFDLYRAGTAGAIAAERFPAYTAAIETGAGILFIGGVVLAGSLLPVLP